jgi:ABC-type uncharacterized transport system involved in gliding motility auxiliary subunit
MASRTPNSGGSTLEKLRLPMAALGVFCILGGLGAWLVEGQFLLLQRILIATGVLLIGIYVALDPEDVWAKLTGRGALASGNTIVIAVAALAILGFVNVLGARYQQKLDLTSNQQFTLSDQSIRLAQNVPEPVKVTAFLGSSDSRRQDFVTLLNDYSARSGGKITSEFIDPELQPGVARAAGYSPSSTVVYQMGEKRQDSTGTTERDVATALVKLLTTQKKLYFTTGHGERRLDGFEQADYSQIKSALERDNFVSEPLSLMATRAVPDDAAAVVIAGPTNPFLNEEKDALRAYLDNGGKLIMLVGPSLPNQPNNTDIGELLSKWNVDFTKKLVIEQPSMSIQGDPLLPAADRYANHPSTQDLRLFTFFPTSSSISVPPQGESTATVTPIVQTTDRSFATSDVQAVQQRGTLEPGADDIRGPLPLVVALEQPLGTGTSTDPNQPQRSTRVYLFGSPDFVANGYVNLPSGNTDLFLNAINWVAEETDLVSIRPPATESRQLLLTGVQQRLAQLTGALFLPLAVLALGFAVWWARR